VLTSASGHFLSVLTDPSTRFRSVFNRILSPPPWGRTTKQPQDNAQNTLLCGPLHFLAVKSRVLSYWSGGKNGVKVCVHC